MAIAQVQKNETEITSGSSTVTTTTCAFSVNVTGGNLLVAFGMTKSGAKTLTFSDNNSNSWTTAVSNNSITNGPSVAIGYVENSNSGATTITLTRSADTGPFYLAIMEYSGAAASSALDQVNNAHGNGTSPSSGNITTTEDGELLIGGYGQSISFSGGDVFTVDGGWTLLNELGTAVKAGKTYEQLGFATGTTDFGGSIVGGRDWVALIASFKAASGGGVTATASGSGSGTGSASATVVINATATGSGSGTGSATASVDIQASASGSGSGTGTANATVIIVAVAAGSGSGDGAAVVTPTVTGSAAGSGSGDGAATAVVTINAVASGSGSGNGAATATVQITGVAAGSGGGTGTATATITISAVAAGSGSGTGVVIVAGVPVVYDVTIAVAAVGAVAMGTPVAVGAVAITLGADMYHVGDTLKITGTFTLDGTETDPTSVSLQVRDPSGNTTTYTYPSQVSKESTGVYSYNLLLDEDGNWFVKWVGEGAVVTATEDTKLKVERTRFTYPPA